MWRGRCPTILSALRGRRLLHSKAREVVVVGAPFRDGQPRDGVEHGPRLLREVGLLQRLQEIAGVNVTDYGDVNFEHFENNVKYMEKIRHPRSCGSAAKKMSEAVSEVVRQGKSCITLGGDHSLAAGTIFGHFGVEEKDGCLIWVDAHTDINTVESTPSGNLHGMPLSFVLKGMEKYTAHTGKVPGYEWIKSCLSPLNLSYIGLRDVDPGEKELLKKLQIPSYFIDDIDDIGIEAVMERTLEQINPKGSLPIHMSFDIDSLDPKEAPSTGTPVKGGLTFAECIYIAETVHNTGMLRVLDMVEVNPELGNNEDVKRTAENAINIIEACLGKKINIDEHDTQTTTAGENS